MKLYTQFNNMQCSHVAEYFWHIIIYSNSNQADSANLFSTNLAV